MGRATGAVGEAISGSGDAAAGLGASGASDSATGTSASAGNGLGRLSNAKIFVSEKGLARVEQHLAEFGYWEINEVMLTRIRNALATGTPLTEADAVFYTHELAESQYMSSGMTYEDAHLAAFGKYDVSPFSVYPPEVVEQFKTELSPGYTNFWAAFK
jgi:hypothetical protein